jgi:type IV secretion system protein TrbL
MRRALVNRLALSISVLGGTWLVILAAAPPAGALFGCGLNPACMFGKGVSGAVSSVASDAITALAKAVLGALAKAIEWTSTLWVNIQTPTLADASGHATGTVAYLQQNLLYYAAGLAVLSTLLGAARIVWHEQKAAHARELARFLVTYVLVSAGAAVAASVLVSGCDQMASWFINQATANSNFSDHLAQMLGLATSTAGNATGSSAAGFTVGLAGTAATAFIAIVLGILAFLGSVIQIMLMLVRGGMLVLLVGTLPLIAAFSNTEMGLQWFRKATAWLLAFALYKPAAAIIYAVAFNMAGQSGALNLIDGVMMLILAILALPALMRFLVPATSALAAGGGAGAMVAGVAGGAMVMRMPTGAAPVQSTPSASYDQGQTGGPTGAAAASSNPPGASGGPNGGSGSNGGPGPSGSNGGGGSPGPAGQSASGGGNGGMAGGPLGAAGGPGSEGAAGGGAAGGGAAAAGGAGAATGGAAAALWAAQQAARGASNAANNAVDPGSSGGSDDSGPSGATGKPS